MNKTTTTTVTTSIKDPFTGKIFFFQKVEMYASGENTLKLEVPGLAENRPSVLKGDKIYVRVYGSGGNLQPEKKEYEGIVHEVQNTSLILGFSQDLRKR